MATFPTLKTNAVIQYPATRLLRYQNQALRFLNGTEQRYRDCAGPLLRWEIPLSLLDDGEMAAIEQFFADNQGAFGSFAFIDPWDGTAHPNCSLAADDLETTAAGEMDGATMLTVVENRG
jgi:hypothetical protein